MSNVEYELPDGSRYDTQGEMTQGPREAEREIPGPRTARAVLAAQERLNAGNKS